MDFARIATAFLLIVASPLILKIAAAEPPPDECTCVQTFTGGGDGKKEIMCDGFDSATHQRCACEKAEINGQTGCLPKHAAAASSSRPQIAPVLRHDKY